jgi:hypothetical protein
MSGFGAALSKLIQNAKINAIEILPLGNSPLNGQTACVLVLSPEVLGLVGQTQVFLNLTDGTGTVWQISMAINPASGDLSAMQNSTLNVVLTKP